MKSIKKNYMYNLLYQILITVAPLVTTPYVSRVLGAEPIGHTLLYTILCWLLCWEPRPMRSVKCHFTRTTGEKDPFVFGI